MVYQQDATITCSIKQKRKIQRFKIFNTNQDYNSNTKDESKGKEHQEGWAGVHFQLYQAHKM